MKIISIVNQKGGVGKTATSVNLSYNLSQRGFRVCLIDFDPTANATLWCGVDIPDGGDTVFDFLKFPESEGEEHKPLERYIFKCHGFSIIPSSKKLKQLDQRVGDCIEKWTLLKDSINFHEMEKSYDIIVIDPPPTAGLLHSNVITAADYLIAPVECKFLSLNGLYDVIRTAERFNSRIPSCDAKLFGIIPTFYSNVKNDSKDIVKFLEEKFPDIIFNTRIRDNTDVSESSKAGVPVFKWKRRSNGAQDYEAFSNEVIERLCDDSSSAFSSDLVESLQRYSGDLNE